MSNRTRNDFFVRLETLPFAGGGGAGSDQAVFELTGPGVIHDQATGSHYLLAPGKESGDVQYLYTLKLREDSDGAEVKLTAFYTDRNDLSWEYGKPVIAPGGDTIPIQTLDFTVAAIRLESIDLGRAGDEDIGLYNGMGGTVVPSVEWVRNVRERAPGKRHYENDTVAPTALVKGEELEVRARYFCSGLDSFDLEVECSGDNPGEPDYCPYFDVLSVSPLACGGESKVVFDSGYAPSEVMASLNSLSWRANNVAKGTTLLTGNSLLLEESVHRIYTLFDEPLDYALEGPGHAEIYPWILMLEISCNIVHNCSYLGDDKVNHCITAGAFNSEWTDYADTYFVPESPYSQSGLLPILYHSCPR